MSNKLDDFDLDKDMGENYPDAEKEVSFEENLKQLEEIVQKLENGDIPLDDAIDEFHKAMLLVKTCDDKLKNAKESIAQLVKDNGDVLDFNVEE